MGDSRFASRFRFSTVQEKNIDYNHLSPSREPNDSPTVRTMACLVLIAKPLKMGKNSKFNKGWEPLKGHKNEEVEKIVKIFYLDTTDLCMEIFPL
ncbi:MAG: hypothetical protein LBG52_06290 [Candidatus Peribacteria bacterium]|nr:hypothetical protein [Candidatus Peribacteria bacterium]